MSVWEKNLSSGNSGLYGYRKGRSERGGGKDGVFWGSERRWGEGRGRCLQTLIAASSAPGVLCKTSSQPLINLLSSCLSAQVVEYTEGGSIYGAVCSQTLASQEMLSHVHTQACARTYTHTHFIYVHTAETEQSWQPHHCLADSCVTMETQHQVRNSCS